MLTKRFGGANKPEWVFIKHGNVNKTKISPKRAATQQKNFSPLSEFRNLEHQTSQVGADFGGECSPGGTSMKPNDVEWIVSKLWFHVLHFSTTCDKITRVIPAPRSCSSTHRKHTHDSIADDKSKLKVVSISAHIKIIKKKCCLGGEMCFASLFLSNSLHSLIFHASRTWKRNERW